MKKATCIFVSSKFPNRYLKFCLIFRFRNSLVSVNTPDKPNSQEIILDMSDECLPAIDPKDPRAYEKLRQRNIAEREKLFRDLKISQLR